METLLVYTLKSAVCLTTFYLFYRLLLSRETFHRFNRLALLCILLLSALLPLVKVSVEQPAEVYNPLLAWEAWLLQADAGTDVAAETTSSAQTPTEMWIRILLLIYPAGILFFALRNLFSLNRLLLLLRSGKREPIERHVRTHSRVTLVAHEQEIAPFSWMRYIVISRKDLEENGREILLHELAHIRNRHSWDLLAADVCIFFQWFNPASWLLKQELQNVHEYEADETVINQGIDAKQYQLLLIKKAVGTRLYSIANSFNHSKLKKRITMMLKEKSSPWARLKYLYVLPVAAVAMTAFARPEVSETSEEITKASTEATLVIHKSDETLRHSGNKNNDLSGISQTDSLIQAQPLYIINGKEADPDVLSALNPDRIESITVLKDESATKEYGEKGKNGVLLITLKKGKTENKANAGTGELEVKGEAKTITIR